MNCRPYFDTINFVNGAKPLEKLIKENHIQWTFFETTQAINTYMATKNVKYASIRRIVSFVFVVVALWIASLYEQAVVAVVLLSVSMLLEDVVALFLIYKAALNPKL